MGKCIVDVGSLASHEGNQEPSGGGQASAKWPGAPADPREKTQEVMLGCASRAQGQPQGSHDQIGKNLSFKMTN